MKEIRYLDKLVDELAKGKVMAGMVVGIVVGCLYPMHLV